MKNKPTKKRTALKITLVLVVITGVIVFLLPSRCSNENAQTEIPLPNDISFESGSSAWIEPEKTDSRAERHDETSPASATAIASSDTGSDGVLETAERYDETSPVSAPFTVTAPVEAQGMPVIAETGTSEQIDEAGIVPAEQKTNKDMNSSAMPDAVPAQADRTATAETIAVIGETTQGRSANFQAEGTRAATDKPANGAVTETIDKNKMLPPRDVVKKIDAVPPNVVVSTSGTKVPEAIIGKIETDSPKVEFAKKADFMPELSRESLKTTVGISKERVALDFKSVNGAGSKGAAQRAYPSSAGNGGTIAKSALPPPKDTTSKNIERVPVTSPESQKITGQQITEAEKSGAFIPEAKSGKELAKDKTIIPESVSDKAEPMQTNFDSRGETGQKAFGKTGALSIGILFEENKATRQGWGIGTGITAGYEVSEAFTIGIKGVYGNDMRGIESFEGLLYGRYYLPFRKEEFGIFAQLGIGGITFTEARQKAAASVLVDISLGVRVFLGNFYLEPYIRGGYMIQIGAGLAFGYRMEG
jgi:hypothetical protein